MQLLDKQLKKKTANEFGDGAEIDLFEALRESFPGDKITRIPKGQMGRTSCMRCFTRASAAGRLLSIRKTANGGGGNS